MFDLEGNWMILHATNFTDKITFVVECFKNKFEFNYLNILIVSRRI